ncbi:hypothetical protein, variant [Aphanomyces invadans]|nr:hypothetical protein, variant [Aphanomyces invadans]ETV99325.1 hypothetical protein, variant [Aphanomyces invadans]|eukprot:XP_008871881.1 hypothetical protein, variant [Aphanomyces invadans]
MRWKGAMAVLLSLGWTVNTTGYYHLEYLAVPSAPQNLNDAADLLVKYIRLCEQRHQQLTQTHHLLHLESTTAFSTTKQDKTTTASGLQQQVEFHCPLTHQQFTSSKDLSLHAARLEPWLKCMVYCRMKKLFWYSPYSVQPQGNLHYPSYTSCRLEVQASSDVLWIRHPFYLYHACLRHMITGANGKPGDIAWRDEDDFLFGLPSVHGEVHFTHARVFPSEVAVVHALVPCVVDDNEVAAPSQAFLQTLIQCQECPWLVRLGPVQSRSLERIQLERKVVGLALVVSGLLPAATTNMDHPAWIRLRLEYQTFHQWLHQQCQHPSNDTLGHLELWVTFLLQMFADAPLTDLWATGDVFDYVIHQVFTFFKRIHDIPLTVAIQQRMLRHRRAAWLQMIGLVVLEAHLQACPVLPSCQHIAIESMAAIFKHKNAGAQSIRYGRHWTKLLQATHGWSRECDAWIVEGLYRLWRQPKPVPQTFAVLDRPAATGGLESIFDADITPEAWTTALFLTLDCIDTKSVVTLLVDQLHKWLVQAKDECVLRGHRLVSLCMERCSTSNDVAFLPSLPTVCTLMCTKLHLFSHRTQEHLVHGLQTLLPLIRPTPILLEFTVLLATMGQDPLAVGGEPYLITEVTDIESTKVVLKPTSAYSHTLPPLALQAAKAAMVAWSLQSTISTWLISAANDVLSSGDNLSDRSERKTGVGHLLGLGSVMLAAQDCSKFVLGHSLHMSRSDIVPVTDGILLSLQRGNTLRATCRCLFRSKCAATPFFIVQCTAGLLEFPCDDHGTFTRTLVTPNVLSLVERAASITPSTVVTNWFFKVWLRSLDSPRDDTISYLLDVALQPASLSIPPHALVSPQTALQPHTYWRVEEMYRYAVRELGRLHLLETVHADHPLLCGPFYAHERSKEASTIQRHRHGHRLPTALTPSRILTRDNLKRIAAIDSNEACNPTTVGNAVDLAKLCDMGYSPSVCAYVLRHYQQNTQGALQWLVNDQNYDDIRQIELMHQPPSRVGFGEALTPSATFFRLNADIKESLLMSCSTSRELLNTLRQVPRESFVPRLYEKEVEDDHAIPHPLGYTLPSMYQSLRVLEALKLEPGVRILDIGTGSGYFVTLLARLMGDNASITSWEQDADRLAYAYIYMAQSVQDGHNVIYPKFMETIRFEVCNAFLNDHADATFDRVHAGASCPRESVNLLLQYVALHGILVVPIDGTLCRIHKTQPTNDWMHLPVEPLGAYSIESLTPPSLQVLSASPSDATNCQRRYGLHGFEEETRTKPLRVLTMDEDMVEIPTVPYPLQVNMLFQVTPLTKSRMYQQGQSNTGLVVTRVGPTPVQLKELSVSNRGSFGTACANVYVRGGGVWFFEVRIGTSKVIQIGWILPGFDPNPESGLGVGDDKYSYAYDGRRKKKWHNGMSDDYWKQSCKAGDVVGCLLDLDQGNMSFLLNGTHLGIAYTDLPRDFSMGGYSPACSMDGGESVWFNFGVKPFLYPPSQHFCPLADFVYLPLIDIPTTVQSSTIFVAKRVHADAVAATTIDDPSVTILIPRNRIAPLDHHLALFLYHESTYNQARSGSWEQLCTELQRSLRISMARSFLAAHMSSLSPRDLMAYLSWASEFPVIQSDQFKLSRHQIPWLVDALDRQLHEAADTMVIEESRHPISHRLLAVTPVVIMALKTLRTSLLDMENTMEKGNSKGAMVHLQRATETLLSRTEREPGDHFQRCRSQLESAYQRIRSVSNEFTFADPSTYTRRPMLEKVVHLKQALELFEAQVSFPSRIPIEAIEAKYVGLPEALSLKVEFDPRTLRTNWKLLFFKDAACQQRWPYVLSRDGFAPFIIPSNHFYYTFVPDTTKTHLTPEWGYAFRVTPYILHPQHCTPTWSLWTAVQAQPQLQDMLIQSNDAASWLQSILRYIRTPAAPEKVHVLSTLVLCLHRNRMRLPADLQPHLSEFLWYLHPELNFVYRTSIKWRLHSNPYFQTLLQTVTTIASLAERRIQRVGIHTFGYHAEMHMWHKELIETVQGLDAMHPATWQPIISKQYNPLHMLKQLFKQFEASIKSDVQRWHKNRRELWIRQVDQAYHPALLSHCLYVFNDTLLPVCVASRECGWAAERNKWLRHLHAACTVGDIAMQLMVLAGFIDVDSHSSTWPCQSYDWRKAVMNLTKTDLSEDGQLEVSGQWTDGHVVLENDLATTSLNRIFEDSPKLFRVRQAENVHVIGAFGYKRTLIRKIQFRLRKTFNNTPCTAGMVFVFPEYPTPEDMMKIQHYDHFTSEKYQSYVLKMRRRAMVPIPGDPVAYFDVTSPHYCQGNTVTVVPDFALVGQYVVVKLLRCYNIRVMEDLADVIKRQEDHHAPTNVYYNVNSVYLWCYKPHEEWLIYPSAIEYMIESKYQAYCQGDIVSHGEYVVAGEDVVLDFQNMVQYTPTDQFSNPVTCRIKRVQVTIDMKIKLAAPPSMEVEYMGFFGLQETAADEAYNTWKVKFQTLAMTAQHAQLNSPTTQLYRVLSEKSPVHNFPSLSASISTYVLYGEIVSITARNGRWGCIANSEAWCLLDTHQPSFFPISQARAAAHGTVPWLPDQPVHCVAPNGEAYSGMFQIGASREVDEELVHMVNKLRETSGRCVTNLMVSDVYASLHGKHKDYPYLSIFPIPAITGRLDVLRAINARLSQCLMFIGIGLKLKEPDWLSGVVLKAKSCLFLETKMHVWKKIWSESYSMERSSEVVTINRHLAFKARDTLRDCANVLQDDLAVYSPTVFVQLWRELHRTSPGLLRRSDGKSWFTKFKGEPSIDDGGLYRETTATTCYELNNGLLPLFIPCSNGKHTQGLNQNTLVPNSSCTKWHECCEWLQFVGVLMGIATQNLEEVFPIQLAPPIWKLLVAEPLTPHDFHQFDVATAQTLRYLRHADFDSDDMFASIFPDQTFTCLNEQDEVVELVPHGATIPVTLGNRLEYADALESYRLHQFDEAVGFIRKGLESIVQVDLLPMFTWSELELLVCGRPTLNLALLRKKTEYSPDMDMQDALVERFWRTLAGFTSEEQQLFLQFVWGRTRLPFSEVDFGSYTFKLVRHMSPSNPDNYLPVAHTCFFQLELPNYSSAAIMRSKLLYAMNHCTSIVDEEQAAHQLEIALWDSS